MQSSSQVRADSLAPKWTPISAAAPPAIAANTPLHPDTLQLLSQKSRTFGLSNSAARFGYRDGCSIVRAALTTSELGNPGGCSDARLSLLLISRLQLLLNGKEMDAQGNLGSFTPPKGGLSLLRSLREALEQGNPGRRPPSYLQLSSFLLISRLQSLLKGKELDAQGNLGSYTPPEGRLSLLRSLRETLEQGNPGKRPP